jgi:acyl dehydratase
VPLGLDPSIIGREFDRVVFGPVTADELIAFARALGETRPEYTQPGPGLIGHPTYCVRYRPRAMYPEGLSMVIDVRSGFDAGKDVQFGRPVRPGDTVEVRSVLQELYEKTGRTGRMCFVVVRFTITNQAGETLAVVDNRYMHR